MDPISAARARVRTLKLEMGEERFRNYRDTAIATADNFVPGEEKEENIACLAGNCSFAVNWQGYLQPCVILQNPRANVFEVGFRDAWKQVCEQAQALKSASKCSVCSLRHLCRSCVAAGLTETGAHNGIPPYMCSYAAETLRLLREDAAANSIEVAAHE